jgi:hypothetical protein
MPPFPHDHEETDPGRGPDLDDCDELDREDDLELERSVARHAEEAEEAELAEEDFLEIANLEDEIEARKGDGNDA